MIYTNPVVKGFYPDPSVCYAEGSYYLVCSSFQFFPGVPIFKSEDLVNWTQIGHVLSKPSQVMLHKVRSSGGVFAPTIRYNDGRFYMVTNNNSTNENFYVYTDDINGDWSEPIVVDQAGIDPSLYFEDGRCFFVSNGQDENGVNGVIQCEINVETGEKLTKSTLIWTGSGGRYIESPHMYKIGDYYYLVVAEGGTEYGHMITYARSKNVWGPFEGYPSNPVLTNRNKAPYIIQAIGHGDLIEGPNNRWFFLSLGFRQIHLWQPYHHLGRECYLTPVEFTEDGWFTAGLDGTTDSSYEIEGDFIQMPLKEYTFSSTDWNIDWCFMRDYHPENYTLTDKSARLIGTDVTLEEVDSPTFVGLRQRDFDMNLEVSLKLSDASDTNYSSCGSEPSSEEDDQRRMKLEKIIPEAGVTLFMDEEQHYDLCIRKDKDVFTATLKLNIGDIKHIQSEIKLNSDNARLIVKSDSLRYHFYVEDNGVTASLGSAQTRYLSSEVASGFTGVVIGLYAAGKADAEFTDLSIKYVNN